MSSSLYFTSLPVSRKWAQMLTTHKAVNHQTSVTIFDSRRRILKNSLIKYMLNYWARISYVKQCHNGKRRMTGYGKARRSNLAPSRHVWSWGLSNSHHDLLLVPSTRLNAALHFDLYKCHHKSQMRVSPKLNQLISPVQKHRNYVYY